MRKRNLAIAAAVIAVLLLLLVVRTCGGFDPAPVDPTRPDPGPTTTEPTAPGPAEPTTPVPGPVGPEPTRLPDSGGIRL